MIKRIVEMLMGLRIILFKPAAAAVVLADEMHNVRWAIVFVELWLEKDKLIKLGISKAESRQLGFDGSLVLL